MATEEVKASTVVLVSDYVSLKEVQRQQGMNAQVRQQQISDLLNLMMAQTEAEINACVTWLLQKLDQFRHLYQSDKTVLAEMLRELSKDSITNNQGNLDKHILAVELVNDESWKKLKPLLQKYNVLEEMNNIASATNMTPATKCAQQLAVYRQKRPVIVVGTGRWQCFCEWLESLFSWRAPCVSTHSQGLFASCHPVQVSTGARARARQAQALSKLLCCASS